MTRKKLLLFTAMVCFVVVLFALTAFAANEPVSYKVNIAGTVIERFTTVESVYNLSTSSNGDRVIVGIKSTVEGFSSSQITEIHIPYGIADVSFTVVNSSVQTIIFDDYCSAKVSNLKNLKGLKRIEIAGQEAQITFSTDCAPATLTEFVVTAPRTNVVFSSGAFKDKTNLTTLDFGKSADTAKPSTFTFNANCFQNIGIESLVLNDQFTTYKFSGASVFLNCLNLKTLYFGKNISTVGSQTFDGCTALEFVYMESITSFTNYTFRVPAGTEKSLLKIYIHTEGRVTVGQEAFAGRTAKGVIVCALETTSTNFNNCKYELHYGVQHLYSPSSETPTCYTSYVTDCPCGRIGNAYYKLFVNKADKGTVKYVTGANPDVPHTFTSAHRLEYANGIDNGGTVELKCSICGTLEGKTRTAAPIVDFPGYSVSESGSRAIVVGVRFNYTMLKQYEQLLGEELEFGLVMAAESQLNGNAPITNSGLAYSNSVFLLNMSKNNIFDSTLKLSNIKDTMLDTKLIMSAYMKIGDKITYFQEDGATDVPLSITYSQFMD